MHATRCAFVSCPSLYFALAPTDPLRKKSCVFEFDKQWENDEGFVFYDYHDPEAIPAPLRGKFDYVVVDPPFISEEVWSKYAATVKVLLSPGGKLLVTSVRENMGMLQRLLEVPLYMAPFRPAIPNLTYQYDMYLSYNPTTEVLRRPNTELPPHPENEVASIRMLNDLKESQEEFARQMRCRDRTGEAALPAPAPEGAPLLWGRVPEGLSEYPDGYDPANPTAEPETYGPVYDGLRRRREVCESFKKASDVAVKSLKNQKEAFEGNVQEMRKIVAELQAIGCPEDAAILDIMGACVREVDDITMDEEAYKALVGEMTRKYKSRIFNHQKVLLQAMKEAKAGIAR
jgi:hypothetical protein